jgi:hypothetical protein
MLEVLGFSVQPAGTTSENGPSVERPSARLSSVRGAVCAAMGFWPCALGAVAPPVGGAPGAACGLLGATLAGAGGAAEGAG